MGTKRRRPRAEIREELARLLLQGPRKPVDIQRVLGCSSSSLYAVLADDWFDKGDDGYMLTAGGRVAAQVFAAT